MKKMKIMTWAILICVMVGMLSGCGRIAKTRRLSVGMTKREVKRKIGKPHYVIDSRPDAEGNILEVWEFKERKLGDRCFWLYFMNGILVQWQRTNEFQIGRPSMPSVKETSEY